MLDADFPDVNQHKDLLESLANYTADIIAIIDADRTIRYLSLAVERVLGYPPDELVGKNALDYVHPEDVEWVSSAFEATRDKPGVNPLMELRLRHAGQVVALESWDVSEHAIMATSPKETVEKAFETSKDAG